MRNLAIVGAAVLGLTALSPSHPVLPPGAPLVLLARADGGLPMGSVTVIADGWALTCKHVTDVATVGGMEVAERFDHPDVDLSILRVPGLIGSVRFADEMPGAFEPLSAYGWHLGQVLMRTDGYQSPLPGWGSTPVIHGCSGGACVNARGELVGILSQVGLHHTQHRDVYAIVQIMGYAELTDAVKAWIEETTK